MRPKLIDDRDGIYWVDLDSPQSDDPDDGYEGVSDFDVACHLEELRAKLKETEDYWEECQVEHHKRNIECQQLRAKLDAAEEDTERYRSMLIELAEAHRVISLPQTDTGAMQKAYAEEVMQRALDMGIRAAIDKAKEEE